jgi:PD-(D/E)XK nuclease superfamily protein
MTVEATTLPTYAKILPDGRWCFHLDNHLCSYFDSCERKFEYRHVKQVAPRGLGSFKMVVGQWWSAVLKDYYDEVAAEQHTPMYKPHSQQRIMELAAKQWSALGMEQYKTGTQYEIKNYEDFGGAAGALRMAQTYYMQWAEIDARTLRIVGAESGFGLKNEVLIGENSKVVVYLTGIPDLVVIENGRYLVPLDHKSKDYIEPKVLDEYKPDNQLAGYCFAVRALARQCGIDLPTPYAIVNLCGRLEPRTPKTAGKMLTPRYTRISPSFSDDELAEWQHNRVRIATRMREAFESGYFARTDDRLQCHSIFMKKCAYRDVCRQTPAQREAVLAGNYTQVTPWEPYKLGATDTTGGAE